MKVTEGELVKKKMGTRMIKSLLPQLLHSLSGADVG